MPAAGQSPGSSSAPLGGSFLGAASMEDAKSKQGIAQAIPFVGKLLESGGIADALFGSISQMNIANSVTGIDLQKAAPLATKKTNKGIASSSQGK